MTMAKRNWKWMTAGALCLGAMAAGVFSPVRAATEFTGNEIDLEAATRVIEAATAEAERQGVPMNIAVVDTGAHLKAFARMDNALLGSIDIAERKAVTSALFRAPTGALGGLVQPGGPLFGLENTNGGLVVFAGGLTLRNADGIVIGAIGVSGGSVEQDEAVAKAGADAL
jgi:uncharacterized protein GlcG (DUF336 family)